MLLLLCLPFLFEGVCLPVCVFVCLSVCFCSVPGRGFLIMHGTCLWCIEAYQVELYGLEFT